MICADTSSLIAYWEGQPGPDVDLIDLALADQVLVLAPVCLCELLSSPQLTPSLEQALLQVPLLEILPGFWERSGKLRARLMRHRYRPKLADTLIAQSCLDHQVPLVTRDRGFAAFQKLAGLRLL
jgi:predicted nucleic acid-binding protein